MKEKPKKAHPLPKPPFVMYFKDGVPPGICPGWSKLNPKGAYTVISANPDRVKKKIKIKLLEHDEEFYWDDEQMNSYHKPIVNPN